MRALEIAVVGYLLVCMDFKLFFSAEFSGEVQENKNPKFIPELQAANLQGKSSCNWCLEEKLF